jgi:hypothetical protein
MTDDKDRIRWLERRLATVLIAYRHYAQVEGGGTPPIDEFAYNLGITDAQVVSLAVRGDYKDVEGADFNQWSDWYDTDKCKLCGEHSPLTDEELCVWGCTLTPAEGSKRP